MASATATWLPIDVVLRQAVLPLSVVYALFLALLVVARRPQGRRGRGPGATASTPARATWFSLVRHVLATASGGYLTFLAIVGLVYGLIGGQSKRFLTEALWGGAFLAFVVAVPGFLAMAWIAAIARGRREKDPNS